MKRLILPILAGLLTLPAISAQTLYYSVGGLETAAAGAGNETRIFADEDLVAVDLGTGGTPNAHGMATFATFAAYLGDEDSDGDYTDTNIGDLDALFLPPGSPVQPTLFDFYFSTQTDTGTGGILGAVIDDGDIVRLVPGGGVMTLISRQQIQDAMGVTSTTQDVNGFTINPVNGSMYLTFTASYTISGTTLTDGGVMRIRGNVYTTNASGLVTSVVPGSAEIVLLESEVNTMFMNAGLNGVTDLYGLHIDPNGGSFVSSSTGKSLPNLWMCDDDSADGPAVVSTAGGAGAIATLGGLPLQTAADVGLAPMNINATPTRNLSALESSSTSMPRLPLTIDVFPIGQTTPTFLSIDIGGGTPSGAVLMGANVADGTTVGGFTPRSINPLLPVAGSFQEFYVDDLYFDPLWLVFATFPPIPLDPMGYGNFTIALGSVPPGIAASIQVVDLLDAVLSPPVIFVTE